jgi:hypothetical protein
MEAEQQARADLLVMTVDSRSERHLRWPIAYEVICESECPVLTIAASGYERHDSPGDQPPDGDRVP